MAGMSTLGGIAGSVLLLHTSNDRFALLVPWLMLGAVLLFTFAGPLRKAAASHSANTIRMGPLLGGQFLLAIYGGYFGAGLGVLMLALFLVTANMDVQTASGIRILCGSISNLVAAALFAVRGIIAWDAALPMLVAAILGGYLGALLVKRLNADRARRVILVYAWGITLWLFVRTHL
jgi:uncharacterized membrane protein YfcA